MADADQLRSFDWKLLSTHTGEANTMAALEVDLMREEGWQHFEPRHDVSPYLVFLYSAFTCQLAYLRMNASERGLELEQVRGTCHLETDTWRITSIHARFELVLRSGTPTDDDLAHLVQRCLECPVSRNLMLEDKHTEVVVASQ